MAPEHLLLGILSDADCEAARLLQRGGVDRTALYTGLRASLGGEEGSPRFRPREVDSRVADLSRVIGYGVSMALNPGLSVEDLDLLLT